MPIKKKVKAKSSKVKKTAKFIAGAAAVGTGLYAAEKVAEKLGVRGGAGFIGKRKGGRRSRKKSAQWYAKNIMRLKLKRRYDKIRLSV